MYCYVRDCPNGLKSLKKKKNSDLIKYFPAPEDKNLLEKWRRVIPKGENVFSPNDKLCDSHFLPSEVLWFTETKLPNGNVRRLLRDEPILRPGTIPSIFPAEKPEKEMTALPGKEKQETPKPITKNTLSVPLKEKLVTPKGIVKNINTAVKEKIETPKSNIRIRFKDPVVSSGKRHPQRVKRRSTILDDYWTDEELNQVHNPGGGNRSASSAKKRRTESGLQPVIRLVPLECLMDKTVSKNKTPSKPIVASRPSTEEIDHELKKVIEIPLLTSLKPKKSTPLRAIRETAQFKAPKKNVSKTKMRIMANSEILVTHKEVLDSAESSGGFNEVKTETPDIEEELARMEMEDENEDVKSSDIVMTNPTLGEDDSVVVKSEEEDDGYTINEGTENHMINVPEGDEIPAIKSESEEEDSVTAHINDRLEGDSQQTDGEFPEIEAVADDVQQGSLLSSDNSSSVLTTNQQQPYEVPGVAAEVENCKAVEQPRSAEAELVVDKTTIEADNVDVAASCKETVVEKNREGEEAKIGEENSLEADVLEDHEKNKAAESGQEIPIADAGEFQGGEVQDLPALQDTEGGEDSQEKNPVPANVDETIKPIESEEISKPAVGEEILEPAKGEVIMKPAKVGEIMQPVDGEDTIKSVENEASQTAEEEIIHTTEDGKEFGSSVVTEDGKECGATVTIEDKKECDATVTSKDGKECGVTATTEGEKECDFTVTTKDVKERDVTVTPEDGKENEAAASIENGNECEAAIIEEPSAEMVKAYEKYGSERLSEVKETPNESLSEVNEISNESLSEVNETPNENVSRSDNVDRDLPETDDSRVNETDKIETGTIITISDDAGPSKPSDNIIDVSDSEGVDEADKGMSEVHDESDSIVNVDLTEADQSSTQDTTVKQSSALLEVLPERKDDENAMEIEYGDPANVQNSEDVNNDVHKDASHEKRDCGKVVQLENDDDMDIEAEVARLVSEVEETAEGSPNKKVVNEESGAKEASQPQPQEIVLQDTTNLGGITAAGVQNLFSPETIQEILKQIKLPLTTPVTFRIATNNNTPSSSSNSGRGRGRRKGMRGTNRQQPLPRASSSRDTSHNSIDLFRHLTRTRTVFDFPTFVPDIDDDIQYWKLCQILKESFHELIETRNTKTSIGKLTLRVAINRPKKPKVLQNNGDSEADPQ